MYIVINDLHTGECLSEREYPAEFISAEGLEEHTVQLHYTSGCISYTESWFEGIYILSADIETAATGGLKISSDTAFYMMIFCLEGFVKCIGPELNLVLPANHCIFIHISGCPTCYEILQPGKSVCIQLTEKFYKRLTGDDEFAVKDSEYISRITPAMQMILKSLGECTHSTAMRRIFLETGVLQLLLMQLELLSSRQKTQRAFLKSHDVQRIQYVKLLMEDNIRNPGTLVELAHKAGLNDFKLKKGFKELYNITVFGYLHELRMHKARQLLAEEKRSVREVADTVGYKNPHHFSSAFKKKFGILPGQLNK